MALRTFNPDSLLQDWSDEKYSPFYNGKTLARSLRDAFDMSCSDSYVYRAQAETTLDITQRAIVAKRELGLHGWYHDNAGRPVGSVLTALLHYFLTTYPLSCGMAMSRHDSYSFDATRSASSDT